MCAKKKLPECPLIASLMVASFDLVQKMIGVKAPYLVKIIWPIPSTGNSGPLWSRLVVVVGHQTLNYCDGL